MPWLLESTGGRFNTKIPSYQYTKSHCGVRWSYDHLISTMVFPILARHLFMLNQGPSHQLQRCWQYHPCRQCGEFSNYLCNFGTKKWCECKNTWLIFNQNNAENKGLTHWGRDKMDAIKFCRQHFQVHFLWILIKISLKFVPKGPINNIPALVQIMSWHRLGAKPLSEPMMVGLPTHICVTQSQWVKDKKHWTEYWV